jgi:hypothetical protein
MASTYSPSLKITLPGDGDQAGLWGQTTNTNLGTLVEQAITGVVSITMTDANYTLTSFNGVSDEARNAVLVVTGTNNAVRDLIPPVQEKLYTIANNTTGGFAIRVIGVSGTGVNIPNGATCLVFCNGTNFINGLSGSAGNFTVAGSLAVTSTSNLGGAITYGGVTLSNAVTGTGSMVLSASPTFTGAPLSDYSPAMQAAILRREELKAETERLRQVRADKAAARAEATGGLSTADRITINVNSPSVIDEEGFSRAVVEALNNSTNRGTNGATNFVYT